MNVPSNLYLYIYIYSDCHFFILEGHLLSSAKSMHGMQFILLNVTSQKKNIFDIDINPVVSL